MDTVYERLVHLLTARRARYRMIAHEPEGVTLAASRLRGHPPAQAAKCMVVRVRTGKKAARHVLAVVPGDRRVDLARLKGLFDGTDASLATAETAEHLAGCVTGTITPFALHPDLHLIVDPALLVHPEIFFNAGRLDRSVALHTEDYLAISAARVVPITEGARP
jgi:Ala-tRNA(Pro) deacylase